MIVNMVILSNQIIIKTDLFNPYLGEKRWIS